MAPVPQILQLDISIKTLFKITCYLLGLYVFFKAFTIIILVYIALIFASALRPIVTYARYLKIPRPIAILLIYLMILAAIVGIFAIVIPPIVKETDDFIKTIPSWIDTISTKYAWVRDAIREYDIKSFVSSASSALASWTSNLSSGILSNAWTITSGIFGGVISLFLLLVMTFYMIVEENKLTKSIASLFSDDIGKNIAALADTIQAKLGSWFRGQMTLCLIIGVVTYIGYSIIGVKYALPLAVIAGILEIVPYFGPNIAGIIAVLAVLPSSLVLAFMVVIIAVIIQQLENNVIVPLVMKQAVGLDPLIVIITLSIGAKLLGPVGAILSVPFVATMKIVIDFYRRYRQQKGDITSQSEPDTSGASPQITLSDLFARIKLPFRKNSPES